MPKTKKPETAVDYAYQSKRTLRWGCRGVPLADLCTAESGAFGCTFADAERTTYRLDVDSTVRVAVCDVKERPDTASAKKATR